MTDESEMSLQCDVYEVKSTTAASKSGNGGEGGERLLSHCSQKVTADTNMSNATDKDQIVRILQCTPTSELSRGRTTHVSFFIATVPCTAREINRPVHGTGVEITFQEIRLENANKYLSQTFHNEFYVVTCRQYVALYAIFDVLFSAVADATTRNLTSAAATPRQLSL